MWRPQVGCWGKAGTQSKVLEHHIGMQKAREGKGPLPPGGGWEEKPATKE